MNETLQKAASALCEALENSDELQNYNKAKDAYNADKKLTSLISEYNVQATLLETESKKPEDEQDKVLIDNISLRLRAIYEEITKSKVLTDMRSAEEGLSTVIEEINRMIQVTIEPESANCTHDCSTCGSCH